MIKTPLNKPFRVAKKDPLIRWPAMVGLFLFIVSLIFLRLFWYRLPPQVPIYYSLPWGENQLAPPELFIIIIFAASLMFLINTIWAVTLYPKYDVFAKTLTVSSLILSLLVNVTILKILFLIT